ncbi:sulfur carrier protein [Haloactinopolyspora alba]|uniref:Sulfur carrier protein n=1 Tax=Haloactinopolyspora alba TaxID=648780 RepID=A0A2P8EFY5_9ACTN|nr:sulfur carrier protein ThiS [Haloactinopolyspora alba]PSL08377.1 sulfur carrier protein [Haloactinopolyspora alba]
MATQLTVNGTDVEFDEPATLDDVVARTLTKPDGTFSDRGIAVAVNHTVIPRADWPDTTIGHGDSVEIITAVQGG